MWYGARQLVAWRLGSWGPGTKPFGKGKVAGSVIARISRLQIDRREGNEEDVVIYFRLERWRRAVIE